MPWAPAGDFARVEDDRLELWIGGRLSSSEPVDRATRLHVVSLENALYQGEERFLLAEFPDSVWVIPVCTPGIDAIGARLHERLGPQGVVRTVMPTVPLGWRRRIGGFLPLFPIPRLARHVGPMPAGCTQVGPATDADVREFLGGT